MKFLRLIVFTVLLPGSITAVVPYLLLDDWNQGFEIGIFKYSGLILIALGAVFYCWSALSFLIEGGGTPALWLLKHLRYLIGEEPEKLVSQGLYRKSRNPMYLGIMTLVSGEAIFLESIVLCEYAALLLVLFNLSIILIEEPHLKKKFGKEYEEYLRSVPRWFRLIPKKKIKGTKLW